jgi:hypothetical protein
MNNLIYDVLKTNKFLAKPSSEAMRRFILKICKILEQTDSSKISYSLLCQETGLPSNTIAKYIHTLKRNDAWPFDDILAAPDDFTDDTAQRIALARAAKAAIELNTNGGS